jgi:hypothetical protein
MGSVFKLRVDAEGRVCAGPCGEYKAWGSFNRCPLSANSSGHVSRCKLCVTQDPEYHRKYSLLKRFNITAEQYDAMLTAQGGVCALCQKPERASHQSGKLKLLAVDHDRACCPGDRSCGQCIRGLLCFSCNVTLGKLEARGMAERLPGYLKSRPLVLAA